MRACCVDHPDRVAPDRVVAEQLAAEVKVGVHEATEGVHVTALQSRLPRAREDRALVGGTAQKGGCPPSPRTLPSSAKEANRRIASRASASPASQRERTSLCALPAASSGQKGRRGGMGG